MDRIKRKQIEFMVISEEKKKGIKIYPADIRRLLGGLSSGDKDYLEYILWHKHLPAPYIIDITPIEVGKFRVKIIDLNEEVNLSLYLAEKLFNLNSIILNRNKFLIDNVILKNYYVPLPVKTVKIYTAKRFILFGIEKETMKEIFKNLKNKIKIEEILSNCIKKSIQNHFKYNLKFNIDINDFKAKILDNYFIKKIFYKKDEKGNDIFLTGIKCNFATNYQIPQFVGYRISYGYGKVAHLKNNYEF